MSNAACQLPHGFHLLRLPQGLLRLLPLGDDFRHAPLQIFIQRTQLGFCPLSPSDINRGSYHAQAVPAGIENASALSRYPPDQAIFFANGAVFDIIKRALNGIARFRKRVCRRSAVVGMQPIVKIGH